MKNVIEFFKNNPNEFVEIPNPHVRGSVLTARVFKEYNKIYNYTDINYNCNHETKYNVVYYVYNNVVERRYIFKEEYRKTHMKQYLVGGTTSTKIIENIIKHSKRLTAKI